MKIVIYRRSCLIGTHGGVEKVISNFANAFVQKGHEVLILTRDKRKGSLFYKTDERVKLVNLHDDAERSFNLLQKIGFKIISKRKNYKKLLEKLPYFDKYAKISALVSAEINKFSPDVILSCGISDTVDINYKQKLHTPIIQMFHSLPGFYFKVKNNYLLKTIEECLEQTQAAQVLMPSFVADLRPRYAKNIFCIGNSVEQQNATTDYLHSGKIHTIIYLARLDKDKQQNLLINAFALLAKDYPNWRVHLWGNAKPAYVNKLAEIIQNFKVENQVKLCGVTDKPINELLKADICAFPSKFEGFGLGLAEAMSVGLPCVGLKSCSAVNELIIDGQNGYLANDTAEDFAEKLRSLMDSFELRRKFGLSAKEQMKKYAPELIWDTWEEKIKEVVRDYKQNKA